MRWQDLPPSQNIQTGLDTEPSALAQALIHIGSGGPLNSAYYGAILRPNYLQSHPPTAEQNAWTSMHMPQNLPTTPLADPNAAPDPGVLARQRMPPSPLPQSPMNMWFPSFHQPPGMTINSTPLSQGWGLPN
jgi:hypothetical protein